MKESLTADESIQNRVLETLENLKGQETRVLDVRSQSSFTDFMIIVTGRSRRHVNAMVDEVVRTAKHAGERVLGVEGKASAEWVLVDLGDLVVHVMQTAARQFYDLERLWALDTVGQQAV